MDFTEYFDDREMVFECIPLNGDLYDHAFIWNIILSF